MSTRGVVSVGMVSIKHGTISHGVDSARLIAHEPIVHENNRAPYRLDTPPIQHRLDCARIIYAKNDWAPARLCTYRLCKNDSAPARLCTNRLCKNDSAPARLCSVTIMHQWWSILLRQRQACPIDTVPDRSCWINTVQNRAVLDRYHPYQSKYWKFCML